MLKVRSARHRDSLPTAPPQPQTPSPRLFFTPAHVRRRRCSPLTRAVPPPTASQALLRLAVPHRPGSEHLWRPRARLHAPDGHVPDRPSPTPLRLSRPRIEAVRVRACVQQGRRARPGRRVCWAGREVLGRRRRVHRESLRPLACARRGCPRMATRGEVAAGDLERRIAHGVSCGSCTRLVGVLTRKFTSKTRLAERQTDLTHPHEKQWLNGAARGPRVA